MDVLGLLTGLFGVVVAAFALWKSDTANRLAVEANALAAETNRIARESEERAAAAETRALEAGRRNAVVWEAMPRRERHDEWVLELKNVGEVPALYAKIDAKSLSAVAVRLVLPSPRIDPGETLGIMVDPCDEWSLPKSVLVEWVLEGGQADEYRRSVDTTAWHGELQPIE